MQTLGNDDYNLHHIKTDWAFIRLWHRKIGKYILREGHAWSIRSLSFGNTMHESVDFDAFGARRGLIHPFFGVHDEIWVQYSAS